MVDHTKFTDTARRVIREEADALNALADALDGTLAEAVDMILNASGRIIISGIGKSGHIARKIAATLASTGTPAHFVHPAEASHGDLGMVTRGDVVLAISNSGEAPELANLIAYTQRFGIPLIGMTSRSNSALAIQSDIVLLMPKLPEACGTGVVPTTSTTMTLALGDALSVAIMEHRAFSADNFRDFHPGGKLGSQLSRVGDLMHKNDAVPLVGEKTPMSDTLLTISQKGFGVVGVLDDAGYLTGIVTDGDLRRNMGGLLDLTAGEVMTKAPRTIGTTSLAEEAVNVMNTGNITCLFVVDPDGSRKVAGILHIHDCLRAGIV
ncbi:arabinose-5-phosphate isomerase [Octadecabacter temperatus]|uniref:Arabinose 5-phosphate isomerase KdsD n=1 Tax=Octadecabacter temperatus TaxID=1458307 RepID=A0A0K0Y9R7_9RHOB|nr:KpsF/GutQ family sugar-phosphate isomerase [Octadecabacter temperatus]AKS47651.1 Arabinose 5-phosphate isomerase KdsD [Octadecabacter temperatus]SIO40227.1 arabinose-5-phosphate isomerase [Octadecabacter temperatus]